VINPLNGRANKGQTSGGFWIVPIGLRKHLWLCAACGNKYAPAGTLKLLGNVQNRLIGVANDHEWLRSLAAFIQTKTLDTKRF
jgi:hypothetical protein